MANNLHISYDLYAPGQDYEKLIERIKSLGSWAKIHKSFWCVNSAFSADEAVKHIEAVLDVNDKVYVADITNNNAAWNSLPGNVASHIKEQWYG